MESLYYKAVLRKSGRVLADKVRIAEDYKSRCKGLLGQRQMRDGEALLIRPCRSIHTFFMRFPLDVLFLDKGGCIVKIVRSIPPFRLAGCLFKGHMVLELKAGALEGVDIELGDLIEIEKPCS